MEKMIIFILGILSLSIILGFALPIKTKKEKEDVPYCDEKYINKETVLHPSLMCRVLTREKLNEMWNCEMKKTLP